MSVDEINLSFIHLTDRIEVISGGRDNHAGCQHSIAPHGFALSDGIIVTAIPVTSKVSSVSTLIFEVSIGFPCPTHAMLPTSVTCSRTITH